MFPSADLRRGRAARVGLAALPALLFVLPFAYADPGPTPLPGDPQQSRVQTINAPVVDIQTGTASIDGRSTVEGTRQGARSRLDSTVLFGKDSATLRPGAGRRIITVTRQLKSYGPGHITVTGYTDDLGSARHGLELSRRRARTVADVMKQHLPARDYRISAVGKGERNPAVPNTSEKNRRKNRRVVIVLHRNTTSPRKTPTTNGAAPTSEPTTSPGPTATASAGPASSMPAPSRISLPPPPATTAPQASWSPPIIPTPNATTSPSGADAPPKQTALYPASTAPVVAALLAVGIAIAVPLRLILSRSRTAPTRRNRSDCERRGPRESGGPATVSIPVDGRRATTAEMDLALSHLTSPAAGPREPTRLSMVELRPGQVDVHLAAPVTLETPWRGGTDRRLWTFPTDDITMAVDGQAAPDGTFPTLVELGATPGGNRWWLNLQEHSPLSVTGHPDRTADLARHIAAQLAINPRAKQVEVTCFGLGDEIAELHPRRIRVLATTGELAIHLRTLTASGKGAQTSDRIDGLVHDQDQSRQQVLIINLDSCPPSIGELLDQAQAGLTADRGLSLILVGWYSPTGTSVPVSPDQRIRLETGLELDGVSLTRAETSGCAALLKQDEGPTQTTASNAQPPRPVSVPSGALVDEPPGAPADTEEADPGKQVDNVPKSTAGGVPVATLSVARPPKLEDRLDRDVRTWFAVDCAFPRLTLLGPVGVRAHGVPLARRKPFYTELLAYLAIKPHGATADEVAAAFNLTVPRVRNDIKVLRDWLGTNPRTGRKHLPDARDTAAARTRGIGVYQVDGVLTDLDLFDRLRQRARKNNSTSDLEQALTLVSGEPFSHLRPDGWNWLFEGDRVDLHAHHIIIEIRHRLTESHRQAADLEPAETARAREPTHCERAE